MGAVHSSTDSNSLQEVDELEQQKEKAKDDDQRREVERRLEQKLLENDLAQAKWVRQLHSKLLVTDECCVKLGN